MNDMDQLGHKLRSLRKQRGLSLKKLGERINCSTSYLSMVENGKVDPGISHLKKIANGLDVTIVDLFQKHDGQKVVIRKEDRIQAEFNRSKTKIEILVPQLPNKLMDARIANIYPGGSSEGDYRHPGEEFGLVLKGRLELTIDGDVYELREGDSFYFSSNGNHCFRNPGKDNTMVVWVNTPASW
ncbi:MAG: cupin domain-containing protein [Desulfobacterales bacterium]|nr:cupin domain-containing protein [Desulfobacterales bacterium]